MLVAVLVGCEQTAEIDRVAAAEIGARLYAAQCARCHGDNGDGNAPVARVLVSKPRDFTRGVYKFRSTPSGSLPTDDDVIRVIKRGIPGTSMTAYPALSEIELIGLVEHLKTFSSRWTTDTPDPPVVISDPPADFGSPQSIETGRLLYRRAGCAPCHGEQGRGDGPSANFQVDDWGVHIPPRDYTRGVFKAGGAPGDLFKTLSTGLNGTPMPSFQYVLTDEERWRLVDYARYLASQPDASDNPVSAAVRELATTYGEAFREHYGEPTEAAFLAAIERGRQLGLRSGCPTCHTLAGVPLTQSNDWLAAHLYAPSSVSLDARMQPYRSFFDENGRLNRDGLAVFAYVRAASP